MSIRAKLLKVLKRIDNTQFNVTPQPAGIRYLNDDEGNILAILTTPVNPNQAEPLTPQAPTIALLGVDNSTTYSSTNPLPIIDPAYLQGTSKFVSPTSLSVKKSNFSVGVTVPLYSTLEDPTGNNFAMGGTNYQVPTGKTFYILGIAWVTSAGGGLTAILGSSTAAADEATVAPTGQRDEVVLPSATTLTKYTLTGIVVPIAAGRFLTAVYRTASATYSTEVYGVEV